MFNENEIEDLSYNDLIKRGAQPFVDTKKSYKIITRFFCSECQYFLSQEEIDLECCFNCQSVCHNSNKTT